eukprot:UN12911
MVSPLYFITSGSSVVYHHYHETEKTSHVIDRVFAASCAVTDFGVVLLNACKYPLPWSHRYALYLGLVSGILYLNAPCKIPHPNENML